MKVTESRLLSNAEWGILGINVCGAFIVVFSVCSAIVFLIVLDLELKSRNITNNLTELKGNIIFYDEILTGTGFFFESNFVARLAAAKNDTSLLKRYDTYLPLVENAINEALLLTPTEIRVKVKNRTLVANDWLAKIELEAINYLKSGNYQKALEILFNSTYIYQKEIYSSGQSILFTYINAQILKSLSDSTTFTFIVNSFLILTIPISIIIGFDSIIQRCLATRIQDKQKKKEIESINQLNISYKRFLPEEFLKILGKGDIQKVKKGDAISKNISVLFTDIRNFTSLTESMNPEESFSFINQILEYLTPVISKNNGFVDKFVGDCIMALFPDSVDDSIKCGHEMLNVLKVYNAECRSSTSPVEIGIGIHFGDVMIGTIGTENRMDSTVISDTVNTASRVESLTKSLGATFVVTKDLLSHSKENFKKIPIGKFLLKGKKHPMTLFQMFDQESTVDIKLFEDAFTLFESKEFEKAEILYKSSKENVSNYLTKVAGYYKHFQFDENWSGEIKIDKDGVLVEMNGFMNKDPLNEEELSILEKIDDIQIKELLISWFNKVHEKEFTEQTFSDMDMIHS
jgi:class 3 adenylate cyclase